MSAYGDGAEETRTRRVLALIVASTPLGWLVIAVWIWRWL